ncbi:MAG: M16 family metallopeptidase [Phycisphaerae bacterium]
MNLSQGYRRTVGPGAVMSFLAVVGVFCGVADLHTARAAAAGARAGESNARTTTTQPKKLTTVEGITEYALGNGLQVLLYPDQSKQTVTVNITYRVGSRHEGRGEAGMAHLLEHMVFKGTPTHENIWGALEDHGARFNGSTWVDRTNYFEILPASEENLEFAIKLEADRMVNCPISADVLTKEMTVVRNEFEIGENYPIQVLSERMLSSAYLWHNYGKSTIGNRSDIERVPAESLRRFYKEYYQPDNATLVVAGRFDEAKTLQLINKYFGAIPRPARHLDDTYTEEPTQDGSRMVILERVGDLAAAGLVYHIPAGSHEEFPAVQVLEEVLTSEPAGRLYKALVETGMASRVSGAAYPWAEPGVLEMTAEVRLDQDVRNVLDKMIAIVEKVAEEGISDEEVERIKTRRLKDIKLAMTDSGRIGIRLSEAVALGDWRMFFIQRDRLKKVTTADVQRAAAKYLVPSNRTAGLFKPTKKPIRADVPPAPAIATIVADYKGTETIDAGEAFVANTENIEKRTHRLTLENGIKVALLSKQTRGNAVRAAFRFHFGTEEGLGGHTTALSLIPLLVMRGTTERDYQQLRDEIDRLQSRISVGGGGGRMASRIDTPGVLGASIQSDRSNIVPAIELLGEILQKPAFAPEQFDIVVKDELAQLEEGLSDPMARTFNALRRASSPWPKDSIHYVPTLEERIERLKATSLGSIKDLHSRFYGASNLEAAVVGDFDEDAVKKTLNKVFGTWKSPSPYKRIARPNRAVTARTQTIVTPDKQMAAVAMATTLDLRDDDEDFPSLEFASYILGQSAKSRLLNRLRQQDGLSYGAGAFLIADSRDRRAGLAGFAVCATQNAAKALEAMREEMKKWIVEGITEQELAEGTKGYALKFENGLADDRLVVNELVSGLDIDRTFSYHADLLSKIKALTTADVQRALKEHLGDAAFVEIMAGDLGPPAAP